MKKVFFITTLLFLASCTKEETVSPIINEDNTIFYLENDNSKYAYNGRTKTFVFNEGDNIQIGNERLPLTIISQSTAYVERCPYSYHSNTIYPAEYVTSVVNGLPHITIPSHMVFGKYGTWNPEVYCPFRCNVTTGNRISLRRLANITDFNVNVSKSYADTNRVTFIQIDSLVLKHSTQQLCGEAYLHYGEITFMPCIDVNCHKIVYKPYDQESAIAIPNKQESVLGYAYVPSFTTLTVYWHSGRICGSKEFSYRDVMPVQNTQNPSINVTL